MILSVGSEVYVALRPASGPRTGPRKNREYSPCLAAFRLAAAMRVRPVASDCGVVDPDAAGVPSLGRLLERIPVVVRFKVTVSLSRPLSCVLVNIKV